MTEISKQKKIALIILIVLVSLAVLGGVATGIYFGVATISTHGFVLEQDTIIRKFSQDWFGFTGISPNSFSYIATRFLRYCSISLF